MVDGSGLRVPTGGGGSRPQRQCLRRCATPRLTLACDFAFGVNGMRLVDAGGTVGHRLLESGIPALCHSCRPRRSSEKRFLTPSRSTRASLSRIGYPTKSSRPEI